MQSDGTYIREEGGEGTSSQEALYRYFSTRKVSLYNSVSEDLVSDTPQETVESTKDGGLRGWFRRLFKS